MPSEERRPNRPSGALTRREVLAGLAGIAGMGALPGLLAACGVSRPSAGGELTFGSNQSDAVPRAAMQAVVDAFEARSGVSVRVNTVDSATFQDQIGSYLQGTPDDVLTWFAGDRMRFFADQGLAGGRVATSGRGSPTGYEASFRQASTASDGRQYFIPFATYPWVRALPSRPVADRGYEAPDTLDDLRALAEQMRADGLVPIAFGNREGWPAMGTFDILDLRLNGYDFHTGLLQAASTGRTSGSRGLRDVARRCCRSTRMARRAGRGRRRPEASSTARPGCTSWARSRASRRPRPSAPISRLRRVPDARDRVRRGAGDRRADQRVHDAARAAQPRCRPRLARVRRLGRGPADLPRSQPEPDCRRLRRRSRRTTPTTSDAWRT